MGLRNLHWAISVAQLLAMFLTTALRILIRTPFSTSLQCEKLENHHELEWATYRIANTCPFIPDHPIVTAEPSLVTEIDCNSTLNIRMQLGVIAEKCGWQSSFYEEAITLSETIDAVMDLLWSSNFLSMKPASQNQSEFQFEVDLCTTRNCRVGGVKLKIKRTRVLGMWTSWICDPSQIEAYLALWLYHLRQETQDEVRSEQEPHSSLRKCIWKVCNWTPQSAMDFDWWIRREYTYWRTPREQVRRPIQCAEAFPVAESPWCDTEDLTSEYVLTVGTHCSISQLCARYLFALLFRSATQCISHLEGATAIRSTGDKAPRELIQFQHTTIDALASAMASRGLISLQDSYTLLIPALRHAKLLPNPLLVLQPQYDLKTVSPQNYLLGKFGIYSGMVNIAWLLCVRFYQVMQRLKAMSDADRA